MPKVKRSRTRRTSRNNSTTSTRPSRQRSNPVQTRRRHEGGTKFKKMLAVWSVDPAVEPVRVVTALRKFREKKDIWLPRGIGRWKGSVIKFDTVEGTLEGRDCLHRLRIGNEFPVRAVYLEDWLELIANIEAQLDGIIEGLILLSFKNLSVQYPVEELMRVCSKFGEVAEVQLSEEDTGEVYYVCIVKFFKAYAAYAAQIVLDGQEISGKSIKAIILPTSRSTFVNRELFRRDMVLWLR